MICHIFLLCSSTIFITSFENQYLAFPMSVLFYVFPMCNKNHTFNIAWIAQLLPSIWGGKVFFLELPLIIKNIRFKHASFLCFIKRIKTNEIFFFQINNHWKPMASMYNWDYDSVSVEWYLSNLTFQERFWQLLLYRLFLYLIFI